MRNFIILICSISLFLFACNEQKKATPADPTFDRLDLLRDYMVGTLTSATQAASDTNYFDITLDMVPIWEHKSTGYWLYVEQAVTTMREKPYRQRVYHLQAIDSTHFSSSVYSLPGASRFVGIKASDSLWSAIKIDSLTMLEGCTIFLEYQQNKFLGATNASDCLNNWGEAAYATSEVSVLGDTLVSWDRGWDSTKTQVWGAEEGGYVFIKK